VPNKYFLLSVKDNLPGQASQNNGELVLIRQQSTAKPDDKVVVLINNEIAIKEFSSIKSVKDYKIQGIVVTTIKGE
jgi:SOS-response transcriptional repressor LexA